jgi:hypothetical protein
MRSEIIPHFFLLPHSRPLAISCSIRGWSAVEAQVVGCCATYRSRARITAELPTVQPSASEASWLSCWRRISASRVSVWERTTRKGFAGFFGGRAISEIISHLGTAMKDLYSFVSSGMRKSSDFTPSLSLPMLIIPCFVPQCGQVIGDRRSCGRGMGSGSGFLQSGLRHSAEVSMYD